MGEHNVRFDELKSMLQCEHAAWQELVNAEATSRTRELSAFAARLDQHTSSHEQLVGSHMELSLVTAGYREASEKRWDKLEVRLCAVESRVDNFISGLKSILEEIDDGLAGLRQKIDNNDLVIIEIKTGLMALRRELGAIETEGVVKEVINKVQSMQKHEGNLETGHQFCDTQEGPTLQHMDNSMSAVKMMSSVRRQEGLSAERIW